MILEIKLFSKFIYLFFMFFPLNILKLKKILKLNKIQIKEQNKMKNNKFSFYRSNKKINAFFVETFANGGLIFESLSREIFF